MEKAQEEEIHEKAKYIRGDKWRNSLALKKRATKWEYRCTVEMSVSGMTCGERGKLELAKARGKEADRKWAARRRVKETPA